MSIHGCISELYRSEDVPIDSVIECIYLLHVRRECVHGRVRDEPAKVQKRTLTSPEIFATPPPLIDTKNTVFECEWSGIDDRLCYVEKLEIRG